MLHCLLASFGAVLGMLMVVLDGNWAGYSVAVFGGALPEVLDDSTTPTPQTSYGIQKLITERLAKDFLVNPQVEVRVREYASQFALVLGEVANPGKRPLRGNTRLIDLLIEVGGFRSSASND